MYNNTIEYRRAASRECWIKNIVSWRWISDEITGEFFMNPDEGSNVETANLVNWYSATE